MWIEVGRRLALQRQDWEVIVSGIKPKMLITKPSKTEQNRSAKIAAELGLRGTQVPWTLVQLTNLIVLKTGIILL